MTRPNHRTAKSTETTPKPVHLGNPPNRAWTQKLQAAGQLATDVLARIEQLLKDNPSAVVDQKCAMLPREIEDSQTYFLQKVQHARDTLRELEELLQMTPEVRDPRELIRTELMFLFVLIDGYRPERILGSEWTPDEDIQHRIREKIESLGIDVINMRERLK